MRILFVVWSFAERMGAELFVCDLARAMRRRGHAVEVWPIHDGPLAEDLRREGILVTEDWGRLHRSPDVIYAHNQPALVEALVRFPGAPVVYAVHNGASPQDAALDHPGVRRHVAVDQRCLARIEAEAPDAATETILNFVDLDRFQPRAPLPERPRRALVFSNYAREDARLEAIRAACGQAGLSLEVIGKGAGRLESAPERVLGDYDLVFAKARAAIEAMAVGCSVVLCDFAGLGPMVTSGAFDRLRAFNFGAGVLTAQVTEAGVLAEIERYDAGDAARVSARIRAEAGLEAAADLWLDLFERVAAEGPAPRSETDDRRLGGARRRWRGLRRVDRMRTLTAQWRNADGLAGAAYRLGRSVWIALGRPGAL
ncbi:MAG: hypothetical protein JWO33_2772 [Caulobacteraceae bacterium]|nr:hypothetical protein [Caulobacteraceae bacterium]